MNVRSPAVAGTFYAKSPQILQSQLDDWLGMEADVGQPIRALIVPHAGYIYSGLVAAAAFRHLKSQADRIHRVIMIGPSHRFHFPGCALSAVDFFSSPLGDIPLDSDGAETLKRLDGVEISDQAHAVEHCLEVQLPFLQTCLKRFTLLPILTGEVSPVAVAKLLDTLWQDEETLLVVSSDLSHYHPYCEAQTIDQKTCQLIEQFDSSLISEQACGSTGINALLLLAKQRGYHLKRIDLKNSGDTAGDKQRVVGYVSYLVSEY